jgi:hypothetical protein
MTIKELEKRVELAEKNGLLKINIVDEEDGNEGIWACFASKVDADIYDKDSYGEEITCFLMNHALIGGPTWGARLIVKTNGDNRPKIDATDLIKQVKKSVKKGDYPHPKEFK